MKKDELIAKYGIEGWERQKAKQRAWVKAHSEEHKQKAKEWYANNKEHHAKLMKEYTDNHITEIKEYRKQYHKEHKKEHAITSNATYLSYCIPSEYELIENYEKAKADNFVGWHCHHRLELHPDNSIRYTVESLKRLGLYLKRPASELIFLKIEEHMRIHLKSRFVK